jgi:hypothetical protein
MKQFLFVLTIALIFSCNNSEEKAREKKTVEATKLIGEWNNLSMRVEINSKNNLDSNEVLTVERHEWESRLKIKPIRTFFRVDSTWNSAHYNLEDSLVYNPSGKWWLLGDSIVMAQSFPSPDTTLYLLKLEGDTAIFDAYLDWDMDSKRDDRYLGRQLKVNRE